MSVKFVLRELTLAAGERKRVDEVASFFMLISNTGTLRIKIAIDDDPLSDIPTGYEYRELKEDFFYKHIDFKNPNVGSITIEYIMSSGIVRSSPTIIALDEILAELRGEAVAGTDDTEKTIGVAQSTVLAVNTSRKAFNLQAKSTNSGKIYLGFTNAVTLTKWFAELQAGQACMLDDYRGPVFAIADAADQKLGWGEW
ncbi:hypothetical protein LCGC14_0840740 [marine sediment metagenome]|uniref:Uncharacterized protein n=1 Tax=marine sediment metagenome TaxID=412755 RepID=A0A0F9RXZ1_9ZZZZ